MTYNTDYERRCEAEAQEGTARTLNYNQMSGLPASTLHPAHLEDAKRGEAYGIFPVLSVTHANIHTRSTSSQQGHKGPGPTTSDSPGMPSVETAWCHFTA